LPYSLALADFGLEGAIVRDPELSRGVNVIDGKVTHPGVAEALGIDYTPLAEATLGDVALLRG
jgi:alanine dehydrogenase